MADLKNSLLKLNDNLNILKEREAKYAGNAPLELFNQINDHIQAIHLIEQTIRGEITEAELYEAIQPLLLAISNGQVVKIEASTYGNDNRIFGKGNIQISNPVGPVIINPGSRLWHHAGWWLVIIICGGLTCIGFLFLRGTATPSQSSAQSSSKTPLSLSPTVTQDTRVLAGCPDISDSSEEIVARLIIPTIRLNAPIIEMGWDEKKTTFGDLMQVWEVPDCAVGWHKNSAHPGEPGNIVISGYNNIKGEVFRDLDDLKDKDDIYIKIGSVNYSYQVEERFIAKLVGESIEAQKELVKFIQPTEDSRLTLVTSWPYSSNTHQLFIIARPLEQER